MRPFFPRAVRRPPVAAWVGLGLLVPALCGLGGCAPQEAPPEPVRAVRTLVVGDRVGEVSREFSADIRARVETPLGFRVGGRMAQRLVNSGDAVRAGQVLARLDPADLRLGQEAAQAAQRAAQTNADQLAAELKRYQNLRQQGFIGPAELERREAAAQAARAQFDQARAAAQEQGRQVNDAALTAAAAGVVTAVLAEPGQVLAAGTPVLRLALDGPRDAVFTVPEDQVAAVRALAGRPGALRLRLWGGEQDYPVTVREISGAADAVTRTFQVKADVGAAPAHLGQTATLHLNAPAAVPGLRLPLTAVFEHQGASAVWLFDARAGSVALRPVTVGGIEGNDIIVSAGVQRGDEVVVAGTHLLAPGQKVRRWVDPAKAGAAGASASAAR